MNAHHNSETRTAFEAGNIAELTGSTPPGSPSAFEPMVTVADAGLDAALIRCSAESQELRRQEDELGKLPGDIKGKRLKALDKIWARRKALAEEMANLEAQSFAGLAAKAAPFLGLDKLELGEFVGLFDSVARDAVRLGFVPNVTASTEIKDKFHFAQQRNLLERTSEQKLLLLNQQYERVLAFYYATGDAEDEAKNPQEKELAQLAGDHSVRMRIELSSEAYAIPAATARTVALKARIMSGEKHTWWDPQVAAGRDADARFLIEDILALGGLDRIHNRDFDFVELLPSYTGPGRIIEDVAPDAGASAKTQPASSIHALGVELQALWDCYDRVDHQGPPGSTAERMNLITERTNTIEKQVSFMEPFTLADVMLQMALVSDLVSDIAEATIPQFDSGRATNQVDRILCSVLRCLSRMTGLSLRDVGAAPYLGNAYRLFAQQDLTQLDRQAAA